MKKSRFYYEKLIEGLSALYLDRAEHHNKAVMIINALMSEYSVYY